MNVIKATLETACIPLFLVVVWLLAKIYLPEIYNDAFGKSFLLLIAFTLSSMVTWMWLFKDSQSGAINSLLSILNLFHDGYTERPYSSFNKNEYLLGIWLFILYIAPLFFLMFN